MEMTSFFGAKLAELTGQNLYGCIGLVRLAIKDAGRDPDTQLNYEDFKRVFQDYLIKRLQVLNVSDPDGIVTELVVLLGDKQSLLTMSIH